MAQSKIKNIKEIVERGTSNGWVYKKYADGTFEADRYSEGGSTGAMTQLSTSSIYYSTPASIALPTIGITAVRNIAVFCAPTENYLMHMIVNRLSLTEFYVAYIRYGSGQTVSNIKWGARIEGAWA